MKFPKLLGILLIAFYLPNTSIAQETQNQKEKLSLSELESLSISELGNFNSRGAIGDEHNYNLGYDASRQWGEGDSVENVLQLGDLEASFAPQLFSLSDINDLSNAPNDFSTLSLSEFPLIEEQSIENLVDAIDELRGKKASDIEPIKALLEQNNISTDDRLYELIEDPSIAELKLGSIELESFTIDSIPDLSQTQLGNFENYQESIISEIPGLSNISLADFPGEVNAVGNTIARIDFVWGKEESKRTNTISGSYVEGFSVPCESNCEYLELDDLENQGSVAQSSFEGKQWIAGRDHWVAGGTGCFSGGREPTGIHPFGSSLKAVLESTDETTDTAEIVAYFNIKTMCGDSPYFIGPIPLPIIGQVKVNDRVFIGSGS